ncbi:hypothetical protein, partial [uncultured Muribaculum sp.]
MDLKQLCEKILTPGRREAVESAVNDNSCRRISLYGLAGSSAPMLISALPSRGRPMLVIGDSLDDAGYLYHDLSRVLGESAVLMFPSGYKR